MTSKQDTSERRKEQVRQLEAATREVMTSEGFQRWIETRRSFHDYSIGNQLLIAMQPPTVAGEAVADHATHVAGFNAWKKLDRSVVKGARESAFWHRSRSKSRMSRRARSRSAFGLSRSASLMSHRPMVSRWLTSRLALLPVATTERSSRLYVALATEMGVSVSEKDLSGVSAGGWYQEGSREVVIDSNESTDEKVRTLTHELCARAGCWI